jgi:acetyl esterase/lipase
VSPVRFRRPSLHNFLISSHLALTPDSPLPTQLKQANAALSHLLSKGISPANIVVGGDSAGGNLVLQLASHILHPLPSIPAPPVLAQPLAGAMLISPWCAFSADSSSCARNDSKDLIPARTYATYGDMLKPGLTPEWEHHCQPLSAPAAWWQGLDSVYARTLFTAGENECPLDHIIETSTAISNYVQDTVTVVESGALHEEVIVKFGTGKGGFGKDYDTIVGFLSRSFSGGV